MYNILIEKKFIHVLQYQNGETEVLIFCRTRWINIISDHKPWEILK